PEATKNAWLAQLLADPRSAVRREILLELQKSQNAPSWPTINLGRTIAELEAAADDIQLETNRKNAEQAARERAKNLAAMAADPTRILQETERLVKQRGIAAYSQIAELLGDLREALTDSDQPSLAEQQARKLKKENPTLNKLTAALR